MSLTADDPLLSVENPVCYLQTQQSARSFSYASQLKQQVEHTERIQAAVSQQAQWQPTSRIKYDSINQFSQKVELYRGRYGSRASHLCAADATLTVAVDQCISNPICLLGSTAQMSLRLPAA